MKERKKLISVLEFLRALALATLLLTLFMTFVLRPMQVAGGSMAPLLQDGERVLINVLGGMVKTPQRFDVVVVRHEDELWVKRVIALPYERVSWHDDTLYIDGEPVDEPFLDKGYMQEVRQALQSDVFSADMEERTMGADEYLLAGDNRPFSLDSRNLQAGTFQRRDIIANGLFIVWPLNEMRWID
ncbi:MAG TPA: signal peptidase I [Candidatus Merdibacter merdavium]|uniref:Signal peptidase I n=1 Tax=Candidatus Merdibacter merdavium TaxID=2838692 RepID=A0A9D2NTX2_9FIRM|nr:signal peptidase I [Candidatus Merdibacter merdavium]